MTLYSDYVSLLLNLVTIYEMETPSKSTTLLLIVNHHTAGGEMPFVKDIIISILITNSIAEVAG